MQSAYSYIFCSEGGVYHTSIYVVKYDGIVLSLAQKTDVVTDCVVEKRKCMSENVLCSHIPFCSYMQV